MTMISIYVFIDKIEFKIYKLKNKEKAVIIKDKIIIPKSFEKGEQLKYIRKIIKYLIKIYKVEKSNIYCDEAIGAQILEIIRIESILQEVFADCGVAICK